MWKVLQGIEILAAAMEVIPGEHHRRRVEESVRHFVGQVRAPRRDDDVWHVLSDLDLGIDRRHAPHPVALPLPRDYLVQLLLLLKLLVENVLGPVDLLLLVL